MSERSLGDPTEEPTLDPTDYDVGDFAAGIRPGRRSVQVRRRLDLYPRLEDVVRRINAATDDEDVDDLIDEFETLKRQMLVEFVVERRSTERRTEVYRQAAEALGITADKGTSDVTSGEVTFEQGIELGLHLILDALVAPEGVTLDDLRALYKEDPEQVDNLTLACQAVNAGQAEALTLDFSQRRSTNRGTRRSSTS